MNSSIILKDIRFHAYHGVLEQEKKVGNTFIVNIKISVDLSKATETDRISDTINYAEIYDIINKEMSVPSNLLEHVAGRILRKIKSTYPEAKKILINIAKERPPITGEISSSAVEIEY